LEKHGDFREWEVKNMEGTAEERLEHGRYSGGEIRTWKIQRRRD
jgi:hypothetical protein